MPAAAWVPSAPTSDSRHGRRPWLTSPQPRPAGAIPYDAFSKPTINSSFSWVWEWFISGASWSSGPCRSCYLGERVAGLGALRPCCHRITIRRSAAASYLSLNAPYYRYYRKLPVLCGGARRGSGSITLVDVGVITVPCQFPHLAVRADLQHSTSFIHTKSLISLVNSIYLNLL